MVVSDGTTGTVLLTYRQRDVCIDHWISCFQIILASCQSWDILSVLVRKSRSSKFQLQTSPAQAFSLHFLLFTFPLLLNLSEYLTYYHLAGWASPDSLKSLVQPPAYRQHALSD